MQDIFANETCSVILNSVSAKKGQLVEIKVEVLDCPNIISMAIVPKYNTEKLEYVTGEWLVSGALMSDWSIEKEDGVILFSSETNINGDLAKFVFLVKESEDWEDIVVDAKIVIKTNEETITPNIVVSKIYLECNHSLEAAIYTKEPTCTNEGYTYRLCSICKREVILSEIGKLDHVYSDWIIDLEPTESLKGKRHKECLSCGKLLVEEIIDEISPKTLNIQLSIGMFTGIVIGTGCIVGVVVFLISFFSFKRKLKKGKFY